VLVLAVDTTSASGSVAVGDAGRVQGELRLASPTAHSARLLPAVEFLLASLALAPHNLDGYAVVVGPGSFTGLRVGISAMQGLAMATGRQIAAVSALDALAAAGANDRDDVGAWMDAQRGEVFATLYDPSGTRVAIEPSAMRPGATLDAWRAALHGRKVRFVGDGAVRYAELIRERLGAKVDIVAPPPLAPIVGRLALASPERAVSPHAVVPIYIRRPDAELARAGHRT